MRLTNLLLFTLPIFIALIITVFIGIGVLGSIIAFFIVLDMVIAFLMSIQFTDYWRKSRLYENTILAHVKHLSPTPGYRIAIVIPVFNEPPRLVAETAIASRMALNGMGDVYVLDDSSDEDIRRELDFYSRIYDFYIVRRDSRKGYKAGAVNNWLARYGGGYDLLMILDADQRPLPGVFNYTLQFFENPRVAFVQIPQYYSNIDNTISLSAYIQLIPFLRVIMRGRQIRGSAFSLGSGTIFRIKHLLSVGGLYEETVTEDIYTSVQLHEKGFESVYVDLPLIWYGRAPSDLSSYTSQQNRWSLGNYQLIKKLLSADISPSKLLDYFNGLYYWLHVGLLTLFDTIAPILFLAFGFFFIGVNPVVYLTIYIPIFLAYLLFYLRIMKRYRYGVREFIYHHGIQVAASPPVMLAFFEWMLGRRKGFRVTPKKEKGYGLTAYHIYYLFLATALVASIAIGIQKLLTTAGDLFYAYIINIFWASWWLVMYVSALFISFPLPVSRKETMRIAQSYEGLKEHAVDMLSCAVDIERAIAIHYLQLSKRSTEYSNQFRAIAQDALRHAAVYSRIMNLIKPSVRSGVDRCIFMSEHIDRIRGAQYDGDLRKAILLQEELLMLVFAQLLYETCKLLLADDVEGVLRIIEDEARHEKLLRHILEELDRRI